MATGTSLMLDAEVRLQDGTSQQHAGTVLLEDLLPLAFLPFGASRTNEKQVVFAVGSFRFAN